jgi:hypothetical protein
MTDEQKKLWLLIATKDMINIMQALNLSIAGDAKVAAIFLERVGVLMENRNSQEPNTDYFINRIGNGLSSDETAAIIEAAKIYEAA